MNMDEIDASEWLLGSQVRIAEVAAAGNWSFHQVVEKIRPNAHRSPFAVGTVDNSGWDQGFPL